MTQPLKIADRTFHSRLLTGTGKFASAQVMQQALTASAFLGMGVTVAGVMLAQRR